MRVFCCFLFFFLFFFVVVFCVCVFFFCFLFFDVKRAVNIKTYLYKKGEGASAPRSQRHFGNSIQMETSADFFFY